MNRSTLILVLLLLVLGGVVLFVLPSDEERQSSDSTASPVIDIDSASVVKIELVRAGKTITLENIGGRWMVVSPGKYLADAATIRQLVGRLSNFRTGTLISSNPEKQALFQVDSSGTRLTVTDRSGKAQSLVIGKMGPSFMEVYFRLPDSKDVYLGEGVDTWTLNKDVKDWRDKAILVTSSDGISEVTYTIGNRLYAMRRDSSGWISGDRNVDLSSFLSSVANLRADDFAESWTTLATRPTVIALNGSEKVSLTLSPALPDSSRFYVQSSKSSQIYVISKWTAQQLLRPLDQAGTPTRSPQLASQSSSIEPVADEVPVVEIPKTEQPVAKAIVKEPPPSPPVTKKESPSANKSAEQVVSGSDDFNLPKRFKVPKKLPKREPPPVVDEGNAVVEPPVVNTPAPVVEKPPPVGGAAEPETIGGEEEGELSVHTVKKGETMTTIAQIYRVKVDQILKWNLLKSISVKPGQELYIYKKK